MATSAILFLITSGWLATMCVCFFILSTLLGCLWDGQDCQSFSILSLFLCPSYWHPGGSCHWNAFNSFTVWGVFRNIITGWPASSSIFHASFLCRKSLTGGGRRPSWQPPRTFLPKEQKRQAGRSFPVRGRVTAQLTRASRKPFSAGHRSSESLTSHPPHWGVKAQPCGLSNILFYFHHQSIFLSILITFSLLMEVFFYFRAWGSWGRWLRWNATQPAWSERDSRSWSWPW